MVGVDGLVRACSAAFVAVYVAATAAGVRLLDGAARVCAGVAFVAVAVVLAFSGVYLAVPVVVAALAMARVPACSLYPAAGDVRAATAAPGSSANTPSTPSA